MFWTGIVAGGLALTGFAQADSGNGPYINGDFDQVTPQGHPAYWYAEADPAAATILVDRSGADPALLLGAAGDTPAVLYTPLSLGARCVASISASAALLSRDDGLTVSLFFLEPGQAPGMGDAGAGQGRISVSQNAGGDCLPPNLLVGLLASGEGQARVDDIRIVADGEAYATAPPPRMQARASDIAWIDRNALSVSTLEPDAPLDDLAPLRDALGAAGIVGLGENSHGARALFRLKHRLLRLLVEDEGFTALAVEMPAAGADTVNAYIHGESDDDRAALLALGYPSWQSAEMWAVIEWLRSHNAHAETRVRVYGLDLADRGGLSVDASMAAEAGRIAGEHESGIVIWADNTHVTRAEGAMGHALAQTFGAEYIAVGLTFGSGHYSAYGPEQRYAAHPAYPGTHEAVLDRAAVPAFFLDITDLPGGHVLGGTLGFRYLGSRPQELTQFYPHRLAEHFDLIGYVEETDSTQYLFEHDF
ncbi:erythromycin esterase family protein [Maricaulis sp.]|uniref:erythromycin esterase family protein n=1 Tax=Maricaulis sp. TaxID=1486257 RepID=UPI0026210E1E|nr:erythromycin esterase family protein [Maricaulis sp.]